jgi:ABC-2 type transport system permease protein
VSANLIRAELARLRGHRTVAVLPAVGAFFVVLSVAGSASLQRHRLLAGTTTAAASAYFLVGMGFAMVLFSALSGAWQITSEHRTRSIGLAALVTPRRTPVLTAKAVVAAAVGALHGVVGVAAALVTAKVAMAGYGLPFPLGGRILWLCLGLVGLCALAGPWGVFVGTVVRGQVAAFAGIVVWTTMVEATVLHLYPVVGRWLPGGAEAAVVADPSLPQRLARPEGTVLLLLWLTGAAGLAVRSLRTRDI